MASNPSSLLYEEMKDTEMKKVSRDGGNSAADGNNKPSSGKTEGSRTYYSRQNGQMETQERGGFLSSRKGSNSSQNWRSGANSRHGSNQEVGSRSYQNHARRDGLSWRVRQSQQPPKPQPPVLFDVDVFQSRMGAKTCDPKDESIPGFHVSEMRSLVKMDSTVLLMHLNASLKDFNSLLKQKLGPVKIMLVVEILAKVTTSPQKNTLAALLAHSLQPGILEQISLHSFDIVVLNEKYVPEEVIKYFDNLFKLYQNFVQLMSDTASEVLGDHVTKAVMVLQNLKAMRKMSIPPELEENFGTLMRNVECLIEQNKPAAPQKSRAKVMREWQPGIDFRELSIFPLPQDLQRKSNVALCPVVVDGPFKNVEHYLDVNFNLMREDFLIPLREGIANFIVQRSSNSNKFKRIENVRFYHGVRFLNQTIEGDVLVTEVLFNPRAKSSRQNWKRSKRLLHGSLLCFTSDLFDSLILGLVVDRQVELLERGILRCELIGNVKEEGLFKKEFIMAESEVYFEAYQHVLSALQNFNEGNFPLKEYIIDVTRDLHLPTYLVDNPNTQYKYKDEMFNVLDEHSWPSLDLLQVNESQFRALHSAMTKKCVVIQGPPGTGKTYLGLLIAKMLLQNDTQGRFRGPMLVVCFTNHALDQFLEGMLSFTKNIVRIGSQSKNEKLDQYNLRVVRKTKGIRRFGFKQLMEVIDGCTTEMGTNSGILKECMRDAGIFLLQHIFPFMERSHRSHFEMYTLWGDTYFLEWLLAGADFQNSLGFDLGMDDVEPIPKEMNGVYASSLFSMKLYICQLEREMSFTEGYKQDLIKSEIMMYRRRFYYMKSMLAEPFKPNVNLIERLSSVKNLNSLPPEYRWILYKYWMSKLIVHYQDKLTKTRRWYQIMNEKKLRVLEDMNFETISGCDVVGMTTTGAARHHSLLQKLGPKIVIVEEAAEAMESHVVACLSSKCEHLILIGDHKQLRPSPAVYKLAKDYNLEISLFERLLMNGISFDTLKIQHRMRPDIADLVFPAVYPELENHTSVLAYDNIAGLKKNLFFITHTHPEERAMEDLSKMNAHEAKFLIALCRHIILQGYEPSQITILTAYLGQMFLLTEERDNCNIVKDVKVTVVDNFQGEENDIILLSLVRSNEERKIGFLASENRVCVSLSRAKKGLYVIGNMDMLAEKSSLWSKINKVLQKKEAIGTHLTLQCLKHPEQLTEVSKAEDFNCISEGGCRLMCDEQLDCGHICKKICHIDSHETYRCLEVCDKIMCNRDHRCQKPCWQPCGECRVPIESTLPCGHVTTLPCFVDRKEYKCQEVVTVTLPDCEHTNEKLCSVDLKDIRCSTPCDGRLKCGHVCEDKCHVLHDPEHLEYKCQKPCTRKNLECQDEHMCLKKCFEECGLCTVKVKRKLPNCNHHFDMECSVDPSTITCLKPCKKKLDCGHACQRKCVEVCGGCQEMVVKEIPDCQHEARMKCCEVPVRSMCKKKCTRVLSCGHNCTGICGVPCDEKNCESLSNKTATARCGHAVRLFCHEIYQDPSPDILSKRCNEPCSKTLECLHKCQGTCTQCCQGRIHKPCLEKCERKLICGHKCTAPCSQACPQCQELCLVRCEHSQCKRKCGQCIPCKKKCGWQCKHQTCSKNCFDFCDRLPCNEPCEKKLKCDHECMGYCGEKCPDLCRVCDPKAVEVALAFLGASGNRNSRLVVLPDCGHVFESVALDKSLSSNAHVVKMLLCPQCQVPIQRAYRYRNPARLQFQHVMQVKSMVFGNLRVISHKLGKTIEQLWNHTHSEEFQKSKGSLDNLQHYFNKNKKMHFGASVLYSLEARAEFSLLIGRIYRELKNKVPEALQESTKTANFLIRKFLSRFDDITMQELSDFERECMRFHLTMQLRALENSREFKGKAKAGNWYMAYEKCRVIVENAGALPKDKYQETSKEINEVYKSIQLPTAPLFVLRKRLVKESLSTIEIKARDVTFDLHEGRWCVCPDGHIFALDDCGNISQIGNCKLCGAEIVEGKQQLFFCNSF